MVDSLISGFVIKDSSFILQNGFSINSNSNGSSVIDFSFHVSNSVNFTIISDGGVGESVNLRTESSVGFESRTSSTGVNIVTLELLRSSFTVSFGRFSRTGFIL